MDLTSPLTSLMNGIEGASLRVLARAHTEFTGRQVATLAERGNAASVRLALLRLVSIGLVIARVTPHFTMYSANREHLLWPAIEVALKARATFMAQLTQYLSGDADKGITVAIYGSVARNESTAESDIDILVVFPDGLELEKRDVFVGELREVVHSWTGNVVQVYDLSRGDLERQAATDDPIVSRWIEEAIVVGGPPIVEAAGMR